MDLIIEGIDIKTLHERKRIERFNFTGATSEKNCSLVIEHFDRMFISSVYMEA